MKSRMPLLTAVIAIFAIGGAPLENEDKAYGELHGRIVGRFRLWPGLAPREADANSGRYVFDDKSNVWRRRDVSCPEVVVVKPKEPVRTSRSSRLFRRKMRSTAALTKLTTSLHTSILPPLSIRYTSFML